VPGRAARWDCVGDCHRPRPHTVVDKEVEFGRASNGISGIETALGVLLALVDANKLPLARAIAALTTGPPVSWRAGRRCSDTGGSQARSHRGRACGPGRLRPRRPLAGCVGIAAVQGKNSPLLGRELSGRVLITIAGGRLAYEIFRPATTNPETVVSMPRPKAWTAVRHPFLRGVEEARIVRE